MAVLISASLIIFTEGISTLFVVSTLAWAYLDLRYYTQKLEASSIFPILLCFYRSGMRLYCMLNHMIALSERWLREDEAVS
jgi:hypothetical protein